MSDRPVLARPVGAQASAVRATAATGSPGRRGKDVADRVAAIGLLVACAPLLLALMALVALDGSPPLFAQERLGKNGVPFRIRKLRTMHPDAEARLAEVRGLDDGDGLLFKIREDPRVTRVGRVLRAWSLDELPQLLNVVRGEMSLVGPRPLPVLDLDAYTGQARRRFEVKPGITGLWQVSGRSDLSWDDAVRLDVRYVEESSLRLDLAILARTVAVVLRRRGAC